MRIDWENFTPWSALIGGTLIVLAAALFFLFNGRIASVGGIVAGLLEPKKGDIDWRLYFLGGLITAPLIHGAFADFPSIQVDANWARIVLAGFLVGAGTRFGLGCTSSHDVSGLSRLSRRSLAATISLMAAGFVTVFIARHAPSDLGGMMLASFLFGVSMRFAPECGMGRRLCSLSNPSRQPAFVILILIAASVLIFYLLRILLKD